MIDQAKLYQGCQSRLDLTEGKATPLRNLGSGQPAQLRKLFEYLLFDWLVLR